MQRQTYRYLSRRLSDRLPTLASPRSNVLRTLSKASKSARNRIHLALRKWLSCQSTSSNNRLLRWTTLWWTRRRTLSPSGTRTCSPMHWQSVLHKTDNTQTDSNSLQSKLLSTSCLHLCAMHRMTDLVHFHNRTCHEANSAKFTIVLRTLPITQKQTSNFIHINTTFCCGQLRMALIGRKVCSFGHRKRSVLSTWNWNKKRNLNEHNPLSEAYDIDQRCF